MQRLESRSHRWFLYPESTLRMRNDAVPQPRQPETTVPERTYGLRVRNPADQRRIWARYITAVRAATGLSRAQFARRLGIDPATAWRWEQAQMKPENTGICETIASTYAVDLDDVLDAAGLRGGEPEPPTAPVHDPDPEIRLIQQSELPDDIKDVLIDHVREQRAEELRRRAREIELWLERHRGA